jgi:hypothetical protein
MRQLSVRSVSARQIGTLKLSVVVGVTAAMSVAGNTRRPGRQGDGSDQDLQEMGLGTVRPPLGENTPGRRSDWFLRVLPGCRAGDHRWER